jgi:hypothetical protein
VSGSVLYRHRVTRRTLLVVAVTACGGPPPPAQPAVAPPPAVRPRPALAGQPTCTIDDADDAHLFGSLLGMAEHMATAGWTVEPFESLGNFERATWCGRKDCPGADRLPGTYVQLSTMRFPDTPDDCFGVVWVAQAMPETGWGVELAYSRHGKDIVGDGASAQFLDPDEVMGGPDLPYAVELGANVLRAPELSPDELVDALTASEATFLAAVDANADALLRAIDDKVAAGQVVQRGAHGRRVPVSADEAARLAAAAKAEVEAARDELRRRAPALQPMLHRLWL